MGIFDSYLDPQQYESGGGLINRLLAQIDKQGQYQPSAGFPGPAQQQPDQASPIAVGSYQMPRVGNADDFTPQQADIPPNAQPAQGQLPTAPQMPQQQLPQVLQPPGTGFGDRLVAGAMNLSGSHGIIPGIINAATGLATGERTDPQGQQTALLRAKYKALMDAGLPEAKARLAVIDPEYAKTIVPQQFGSDNLSVVQTGENDLGRKTYQVFNKKTGELQPIAPGSNAESGGIGDMNKTGADYLATLPKEQQNIVRGMVEGTIPPPNSFALAKPYWTKMISAAQSFDPTFDASKWSGRVAGVKDFSAGKSSEMVRSANQTIGHVGDLIDKMDALKNGDYPLKNKAGNYINSQMGSGAVTGFQQTAHAVADEMSKVFKGAGISDHEIRQWEENLSPDMSPAQQREAVTTAMSLLQHSLSALEEKRLNSVGPVAAEKAGPLLKPDAQAAIDRIQKWAKPEASNTPTGTARTGVKWSVE